MSPRVLIIDDEESIRFTFKTFLSNAGYDVMTAASGSEAMATLDQEPVDIVFSDIILGTISGLDLLKAVTSRQLFCPVIMITGQPTVETAAESVRLGAFDYLLKPIRKEDLLKVADAARRFKSLMDEKNRIQAENDRYRENLEAIFRSVRDVIITVDSNRRIREVNPVLETIGDLTPADIVGRSFDNVRHPCLDACKKILETALSKKQPVRERSIEWELPGEHRRIMVVSAYPLQNRDTSTAGAVLVLRDITRITELENQLREQNRYSELVGNSKSMQEVYALIRSLAGTDATVLITGESGTGKSLVARALHAKSPRAGYPMVTVSCSALAESILESELFGHTRGAFTGAVSDKIGRFEACHKGSIFLDEIGEVTPMVQVKLLRVLQDKVFERVGENTPRRADVRIIAATNRQLRDEVARGAFREDLYYRLNVVEIKLPPLRGRMDDIPLLVQHFCEQFSQRYGKDINGVTEEVLHAMRAYDWPGNVRELEHSIEHAFALSDEKRITLRHLPAEVRRGNSVPHLAGRRGTSNTERRGQLEAALKSSGGNKAKAARWLGVSRQTLYRQLRKYLPESIKRP